MSPIDPIIQYATQHLGGRTMPDDLRKLLNLQWRDAAGGSSNNLLKDAGVTFLDGGRMPGLIAAVCIGRDDLEGAARLAYAQAMGDMVRYSGFVAEDAAGDAIGYWFSPDRIPIETAPLLRFDTDGNFSILPGNGIAEAILVIASRDNNLIFSKLRDYLNEQGLNITARTIQEFCVLRSSWRSPISTVMPAGISTEEPILRTEPIVLRAIAGTAEAVFVVKEMATASPTSPGRAGRLLLCFFP
jgi:hypothetical protein